MIKFVYETKPISSCMHKRLFCQNLLDNALKTSIHAKRKKCLSRFLSDLMDYDTKLSITEIGKKLTLKSTLKSKIYAAQTFVNNFMHSRNDPIALYEATNQKFPVLGNIYYEAIRDPKHRLTQQATKGTIIVHIQG